MTMDDFKKRDETEAMSRQVRRKLEREGVLRSDHDRKEDARIKELIAQNNATLSEQQAKFEARIRERNARAEASKARGRRNIYTCEECFGHIVTCDVAEGVTPFMIGCKATEGCKGMMQSSMYRVWDQRLRPDFEWYKPDATETATLPPGSRDHVEKGGLILREAPKP